MRPDVRAVLFGIVALAPFGMLAGACSSTSQPPGIGNGPMPTNTTTATVPKNDAGKGDVETGPDGALGDAGDASRADSNTAGDAGSPCGNAEASGAIIQEIALPPPMPEAGGGPLMPGTFVLSAVEYYSLDAGGYTGLLEQKTMIVGLGTYSYDEAVGTAPSDASTIPVLNPAALSGGSTQVVDTTLDLTQVCPSATTRTYPFTSQNGQLTLFNGQHVEYFQIQQ